jgi:peptidoglycan hydrolase-like protein with peptidoglycan-binding domain
MTFPDETGLRRGAHGDGVVLLQRYLDRFGWSAVAEGDFGPETESALRRFQAFHGLVATGVLDEPTVERRARRAAATRTSRASASWASRCRAPAGIAPTCAMRSRTSPTTSTGVTSAAR